MNGNTLTVNGEQLESEQEVQVLDNGLTMPYRIGDLDLGAESERTRGDESNIIVYFGKLEEYNEDGYEYSIERYVRLDINRRSIEVFVEDERIPWSEERDAWNCDEAEIIRSESKKYKSAGYAFRRLYKECNVDVAEHDISFDFSR